jgi:hypothetical protein
MKVEFIGLHHKVIMCLSFYVVKKHIAFLSHSAAFTEMTGYGLDTWGSFPTGPFEIFLTYLSTRLQCTQRSVK